MIDGTPLHLAAMGGNTEVAEILLSHGADPKARSRADETALHVASSYGRVAIATLLLDKGAEVNAKQEGSPYCWRGETPLHKAAGGRSSAELINLLLSRGGDLSAKDARGRTPLHTAVMGRKRAGVVSLMVEKGAAVDAGDNSGWTPLHLASRAFCREAIQTAALPKDEASVLNTLLRAGADINAVDAEGFTPLHHACATGNLPVLEFLLDHAADMNARPGVALDLASLLGYANTMELLLARGADPNTTLRSTFRLLSSVVTDPRAPLPWVGDSESQLMKHFSGMGPDVGTEGGTALHSACLGGHAPAVALLLSRGADVNARNAKGQTPLHMARAAHSPTVVRLLLGHGASPVVKDRDGRTPLAMTDDRAAHAKICGQTVYSPYMDGISQRARFVLKEFDDVIFLLKTRSIGRQR